MCDAHKCLETIIHIFSLLIKNSLYRVFEKSGHMGDFTTVSLHGIFHYVWITWPTVILSKNFGYHLNAFMEKNIKNKS